MHRIKEYTIEFSENEHEMLVSAAKLQNMIIKDYIKHAILFEAKEDLDFKKFIDAFNVSDSANDCEKQKNENKK